MLLLACADEAPTWVCETTVEGELASGATVRVEECALGDQHQTRLRAERDGAELWSRTLDLHPRAARLGPVGSHPSPVLQIELEGETRYYLPQEQPDPDRDCETDPQLRAQGDELRVYDGALTGRRAEGRNGQVLWPDGTVRSELRASFHEWFLREEYTFGSCTTARSRVIDVSEGSFDEACDAHPGWKCSVPQWSALSTEETTDVLEVGVLTEVGAGEAHELVACADGTLCLVTGEFGSAPGDALELQCIAPSGSRRRVTLPGESYQVRDAACLADGSFLVIGHSDRTAVLDRWIPGGGVKRRVMHGDLYDLSRVAPMADGGWAIAGTTSAQDVGDLRRERSGAARPFVTRYAPDGQVRWARDLAGLGDEARRGSHDVEVGELTADGEGLVLHTSAQDRPLVWWRLDADGRGERLRRGVQTSFAPSVTDLSGDAAIVISERVHKPSVIWLDGDRIVHRVSPEPAGSKDPDEIRDAVVVDGDVVLVGRFGGTLFDLVVPNAAEEEWMYHGWLAVLSEGRVRTTASAVGDSLQSIEQIERLPDGRLVALGETIGPATIGGLDYRPRAEERSTFLWFPPAAPASLTRTPSP